MRDAALLLLCERRGHASVGRSVQEETVKSHQRKRTVLVPILGGDISDTTLATASALLARHASRLVLLHVSPTHERAGISPGITQRPAAVPRWRRLADSVGPDRTFVEAVAGNPPEEVLAEADRFHSDIIVLGPPDPARPNDAWINRTILQLKRASPRRVRIANTRRSYVDYL
jgi:Universal stress protein family